MGYLAGYDWDVFVSYARNDDIPLVQGEPRWVYTFAKALKVAVRNYLGEEIDLFFDRYDADAGRSELDDIKRAAASSAIMVVIASPTYCRREWTLAELQTFRDHCSDLRRLMVVERLPLGTGDCWPEVLEQKNRLQFWYQLPDTKAKAPLPAGSERFNTLLMDFANKLQEQLRQLRRGVPDSLVVSPVGPSPDAAPSPPGADSAGKEATDRRTLLIAQGTDDVADTIESVRRHLGQFDDVLTLLPEGDYPQGGQDFAAAFESDLAKADIFVQLLGRRAGRVPPDLPGGYTRFQLERARAAGKPIVQWRHPEIDPQAIEDETYRAMLDDPSVIVCGLEEFKRHLIDKARERPPEPVVFDAAKVFVNADRDNLVTAKGIAVEFKAENYRPMLPKFDGTTKENRTYLNRMMAECGVVVIVNGVRPPTWFDNQKRLFEIIRQERHTDPEGLAVCTVPPADELAPDEIGNEFVHIDCSDGYHPRRIRDYIHSLKQREPPPRQPAS